MRFLAPVEERVAALQQRQRYSLPNDVTAPAVASTQSPGPLPGHHRLPITVEHMMSIAAIAQRRVVTVDEHASLQEAAQLMRDRHVGAVAVTRGDAGSVRLVGVVTDRDLALQVVAEGHPRDAEIASAICGNPVAIRMTASTAEAAQAMRESGVRRLLLLDSDDRLAGIVTLDDLIASYADQLDDLSGALERGIEREVERQSPSAEAQAPPVIVPPDLAIVWHRVFEP